MSTWEDDVIPERNEDSLGVVGKVFIIILLILHLCLAVSLIHVWVRFPAISLIHVQVRWI